MSRVVSQHLEDWFRRHRNAHRTVKNGTEIACPNRDAITTALLVHRATVIRACPICRQPLGPAVPLVPSESAKEYQWPNAA